MKYGFSVLFLLVFFMNCSPAVATTYYFSTSGSDANSGLSSNSPKKSLIAANELMTRGNTILFKRGDIWYFPQGTINRDNKSNCILDAYGKGTRPIIAGMALIDDTWTYEGKSVWSNPTGYADALRVFVNNVSRISLHDKVNNNPVVADLNSNDEYFFDRLAGKLYLFRCSP